MQRTSIAWCDYSSNPVKALHRGRTVENIATGEPEETYLDERELHRMLTFRPKPSIERCEGCGIFTESGPRGRLCDIDWIRSLRDQCQAAGVPVFVKQLGRSPVEREGGPTGLLTWPEYPLRDRKGGSMEEWPEDLRVREMPLC